MYILSKRKAAASIHAVG